MNRGLLAKIGRQPAAVWLWSDRRLTIFGTDAAGAAADPRFDIRCNDFAHIERFEQSVPWLTRAAFVESARARIADGGLVFTLADASGPLLAYGYAQAHARETLYTHVGQRVCWPARTATIYGGFVHPTARGRRLHSALQSARIHHLIDTLGMEWVVSGVASDNVAAQRSAARTNLRPVAELQTRRRFGRASMHAERRDPAFAAVFPDAAQP